MKGIVYHWTGGANAPNDLDRKHYHFLVDSDGVVHEGDLRPEANLNISDGNYAAHTRAFNTGRIGIGLCGMLGAKEHPFSPGDYPLTEKQIVAACQLGADLCDTYGIEVTKYTVNTHAEVEVVHGIPQPGKWDINWLPGMAGPGSPTETARYLRHNIAARRGQRGGITGMGAKSDQGREHPAQSSTIRATVAQTGAAAGGAITAVSQLDGTTQHIVVGGCVLIALLALFIFRERIKHWRAGVK